MYVVEFSNRVSLRMNFLKRVDNPVLRLVAILRHFMRRGSVFSSARAFLVQCHLFRTSTICFEQLLARRLLIL
jgi:hypothetical protein